MECSIESTGYVMSARAAEVYVNSCAEVAVGLMFYHKGNDSCWHARPSVGVLHPEVCCVKSAILARLFAQVIIVHSLNWKSILAAWKSGMFSSD